MPDVSHQERCINLCSSNGFCIIGAIPIRKASGKNLVSLMVVVSSFLLLPRN